MTPTDLENIETINEFLKEQKADVIDAPTRDTLVEIRGILAAIIRALKK